MSKGSKPSQKQLGNFMDNKEMPEGLCPVGQIFWRVEVEDKDISPGLKEILEKSKEKEKENSYRLLSSFIEFNG